MEGARRNASTGRHPHHHIGILSPAPVELGEVVDDLVESAGHKVGELHFHHGLRSGDRQPEPRAHNGTLAEWCVADAVFTEQVDESIGHLEHAAVGSDVLAHQDQFGVALHGLTKAFGHRVDEPQLAGVVPGCAGGHEVLAEQALDFRIVRR